MKFTERPVVFRCNDDHLLGIVAVPEQSFARGVLIVVGGPQYRAGSHRQFTLLARALAQVGIPVMRFDYRGTGDSEGTDTRFDATADDIRAAIDRFIATMPSLTEIVLWGLCDAASAAMLYAADDSRIKGIALLNPWVRTEQGIAQTYLKHYYRQRVFEPGLWKKILSGKFDVLGALRSLLSLLSQARRTQEPPAPIENDVAVPSLPQRLLDAMRHFHGKVLLITSGNDLTAREFDDMVAASQEWQALLAQAQVTRHLLPDANHTFASAAWRDQVANWTRLWVRSW